MSTTATLIPQTTETSIPDFGSGRYSNAMLELYKDLTLFSVSKEKREKIARQFGSDFGAAIRDAKVDVQVGKASGKDSKMTLKESCGVKGITATPSLSIARAVQFANEAFKNGVSRMETGWKFTDFLQEYVENL